MKAEHGKLTPAESKFLRDFDALKADEKGRYYFCVPTDIRRSGQYFFSEKTIANLIRKGFIKREGETLVKSPSGPYK